MGSCSDVLRNGSGARMFDLQIPAHRNHVDLVEQRLDQPLVLPVQQLEVLGKIYAREHAGDLVLGVWAPLAQEPGS